MADSPTASILTWNTTNWITVVLMAAIGFFLLGLAQAYYQKKHAAQQ